MTATASPAAQPAAGRGGSEGLLSKHSQRPRVARRWQKRPRCLAEPALRAGPSRQGVQTQRAGEEQSGTRSATLAQRYNGLVQVERCDGLYPNETALQ